MTATTRKIGEIAGETGMTVRTLRYYEEIGLMLDWPPKTDYAADC